jgi:hypothetical protein
MKMIIFIFLVILENDDISRGEESLLPRNSVRNELQQGITDFINIYFGQKVFEQTYILQ